MNIGYRLLLIAFMVFLFLVLNVQSRAALPLVDDSGFSEGEDVEEKQWRITIDGWDTRFFGDEILAGGIRVYWRIVVDLKIGGGEPEQGSAGAKIVKMASHSQPAGVYKCVSFEGEWIDKNLDKHKTPFIKHKTFSIPVTVSGENALLVFPENFIVFNFKCKMDIEAAGEHFGSEELDGKRKSAKQKDIAYFPHGKIRINLKDGWTKEFGHGKSMDYERIIVNRID